MSADERQLARRDQEPRRVEATADDVVTGEERVVQGVIADLIKQRFDQIEEEILFGYVGGRADDERARAEHKRQRSKRVVDQAIDYSKLRTPEADAPPKAEPVLLKAAIRQAVEGVADPSLRRALLEEMHREDR